MDEVNRRRLLCLIAVVLGGAGCVEVGLPAGGDQTHAPLWPLFNMHADPAFEDQQHQDMPGSRETEGMRYPAPATIARDHRPTAPEGEADREAALKNPVPITRDTIRYGRISYEKTCAVCHGMTGRGDGPVAGPDKIANVPDIASATARAPDYSDARLYRIISHGTGRMWSYKSQLDPMERWTVVNYVRALQRAREPEPWDYE